MFNYDDLLTLSEYIEKNGDDKMWDGVIFAPTENSSVIKSIVEEWFEFRRVTDNIRFPKYFNRKMKILVTQYNELYRLEQIQIDPMVTKYLERELTYDGAVNAAKAVESTDNKIYDGSYKQNGSTTTDLTYGSTGTDTTEHTGTVKDNETQDANGNITNSGTISDKIDGTVKLDTDNLTNTHNVTTGSNSGRSLNGNLPMSETYGTGLPEAFDWKNASAQSENKDTNTSDLLGDVTDVKNETTTTDQTKTRTLGDKSETSDNLTTNGTKTYDETFTETKNLKNTETGTKSFDNSGTSNNKTNTTKNSNEKNDEKKNSTTRERYTGRNGYMPSEMLTAYRTYIYNTNATKWLLNELEVCFMADFD